MKFEFVMHIKYIVLLHIIKEISNFYITFGLPGRHEIII